MKVVLDKFIELILRDILPPYEKSFNFLFYVCIGIKSNNFYF
jgi:hypothetical protein